MIPRGFYQTGEGYTCDFSKPSYVRGILIDRNVADALPSQQKFDLMSSDIYPRYRLYGGPFLFKQDADQWDSYLFFWANDHGQLWFSHGVVCIAPDYDVKWPEDHSVQWEWVWEDRKPPIVNKDWDPNAGRYVLRWS